MRGGLTVLARPDFRRLWLGASVSLMGDGMTVVALSWLVLNQPGGVGLLGLLGVCHTAPVLVGGWLAGPLLDRFDKRYVPAADSLLRGGAVASVPVAHVAGGVPVWLPFLVAACYGLLKMVPLAGVPAAIPDLVDAEELDAANALESMAYAISGIVGFSAAGALVGVLGAPWVLAVDAVTFWCFAMCVLDIRRPLRPRRDAASTDRLGAEGRRLTSLRRDPAVVRTTLAFMAFNVAEGALVLVVAPWPAKERMPGGPATLALFLAALSAGELVGGAVAGAWRPRLTRVRAIAAAQITAAAGFLAVLAGGHRWVVAAGFGVIGMLGVLMTVWAQSLRMERIPAELRGRAFATLRTLMQATPPLGALIAGPLLAHGRLGAAACAMAAIAGLPALALLTNRAAAPGAAEPKTPARTPGTG
ncbi:MFS transporter [Embleya sp. NPDC001921]